jgi:hypothetical protein
MDDFFSGAPVTEGGAAGGGETGAGAGIEAAEPATPAAAASDAGPEEIHIDL